MQVESSQPGNSRVILAATILGSSMAFIDGTVVNVALPALQNGLHASLADVQWVVESYQLMLAALLLVGGSLGDMLGRRRIYMIGVAVFAAASAWCGAVNSVDMLIWARSIQGVGAALLVPGSLALITASFPPETRGRAIGTWSGFTAITAMIGPVLGGWLVEHATWRWVFLINVPLAAATLLLCTRVAESRNEHAQEKVDWYGAILGTVGLGGITYALIEWPNRAKHQGHLAPVGLVLGVAALLAFFIAEHRSDAPMISLQLFRSRNFTGANLLTLFLYASLGGLMFFFPLDLIQVQHYTATEAGATFLPFVCIMFGLSRWAGGLVARYGSRLPLTVGPLIAAAGVVLFAVMPQGGSYWTTFFPAVVVLGFGMTISVAPLTTTVMNAVPEDESGMASGVNNAMSRLASLLAVAVFGAVLVVVFNHTLDQAVHGLGLNADALAQINASRTELAAAKSEDPRAQAAIVSAFIRGYRMVLWVAAALAALSGVIGWLVIEKETPQHN